MLKAKMINRIRLLAGCRFGTIYQRPQALATAFAETGVACEYFSTLPLHRLRLGKSRSWDNNLLEKTFWMALPARLQKSLPYLHQLDNLLAKVQSKNWFSLETLTIVSHPVWANLILHSNIKGPVVYDCYDDWGKLEEGHVLDLDLLERSILPFVTLATVTTPQLAEKLKTIRPELEILLSPNAVEFHRFREMVNTGQELRQKMNIYGPVAGFLGAIYDWIDEELLYELASRLPHINLMLCGPIKNFKTSRLEKLPNVYFTGMIAYPDVPKYIDLFDVALVPFRKIERMNTINSNKFYQYLCMGKPIVTVDIPSVHEFGSLMSIASDISDFVTKVQAALQPEMHSQTKFEGRIAYAKQNSWQKRAETIISRIDELGSEESKKS